MANEARRISNKINNCSSLKIIRKDKSQMNNKLRHIWLSTRQKFHTLPLKNILFHTNKKCKLLDALFLISFFLYTFLSERKKKHWKVRKVVKNFFENISNYFCIDTVSCLVNEIPVCFKQQKFTETLTSKDTRERLPGDVIWAILHRDAGS
jgi:hypothetical protein